MSNDDWAAVAADPARPAAERWQAAAALLAFHRQAAERVVRRRGSGGRRIDPADLVARAEDQLLAGKYRPEAGGYAGWCLTVMDRYAVDVLRRRRREVELAAGDADPPARRPTAAEAMELPAADLGRMRGWRPPRRRVVVAARSGLWEGVPPAEWAEWVAAAGAEPPFPEPGFNDQTVAAQTQALAAALGVPANHVAVDWSRGRPELLRLEVVQALVHRDRPGGAAGGGS